MVDDDYFLPTDYSKLDDFFSSEEDGIPEDDKESYNEEELKRSISLFPGETVTVHPKIKERKAKKSWTCDFSGASIERGTYYIEYNLFLSTKSGAFVLQRPIRVEIGYKFDLPIDISQLEDLDFHIFNYEFYSDDNKYNNLFHNYNGGLPLKKLPKSKRKIKKRS